MAEHFLQMFAADMGREDPRLTHGALSALENYHFPGNIRELKNMIEHALIRSDGAPIAHEHLHFIQTPPPSGTTTHQQPTALHTTATARPSALSETKILAYVRQHGHITNPQCRELLGCNVHHASYLLKKMRRDGALVREGEHRWSFYRLSNPES